jgi:hypothetical protein
MQKDMKRHAGAQLKRRESRVFSLDQRERLERGRSFADIHTVESIYSTIH